MPSTIMQSAVTTLPPAGKFYMLILDGHGKPLVLAPIQTMLHHPFPPGYVERLASVPAQTLARDPIALTQLELPLTFVRLVESALRRLDDLVYLGEHPLSEMQAVTLRLEAPNVPANLFHRARILHALLEEAIEQLRPVGPLPARASVPRRVWHPYLILSRAYVEGDTNYMIMNWLQISEGTFNRTRRTALRAIARVLAEWEAQ